MHQCFEEEKTVRQPTQSLYEPAVYSGSGWIHLLEHSEHSRNGKIEVIQAETMKNVVEQQKMVMKDLDIDKLDDLRDEMDEMKYESDYMNEMLNRDYDCDVDEDDLDEELGMLEQELKAEKQIAKKKQISQPQQLNNL